LLLRVFSSM